MTPGITKMEELPQGGLVVTYESGRMTYHPKPVRITGRPRTRLKHETGVEHLGYFDPGDLEAKWIPEGWSVVGQED